MVAVSAIVDENEIRGPMAEVVDDAIYTWGPQDFVGFYYDLDDDFGREFITMHITGDNVLDDEPESIIY